MKFKGLFEVLHTNTTFVFEIFETNYGILHQVGASKGGWVRITQFVQIPPEGSIWGADQNAISAFKVSADNDSSV